MKSKTLSIAAVLTFITGIGMFSSIYLTPVVAQRLLSLSPSQTGVLLLPGAILAILALIISAKLLQKGVSSVIIIFLGFAMFIYFNWNMSQLTLDTSSSDIAFALCFRAIGMALLTVPLTALAISSLKEKDIPQGAALNNMMRQLGGSFGISIVNTYMAYRIASHRNDLASHITATNPLAMNRINQLQQYFMFKGFGNSDAYKRALKVVENIVMKQSALLSYRDAYFLVGLLFVIGLPLLLFVAKQKNIHNKDIVISDH